MILTKRKKFFIVSGILAWGLLTVQFMPFQYRYLAIGGLTLLAYILSAWSLLEDLDGVEWLVNLIVPTLFLPSIALFNFLLPDNLMVRLGLFFLAALGQYGVLLSANIFSVAVIRTIQLLRAAQAVGFLFTLGVAFFLFDTLFSFRFFPFVIAPVVFLISFPLSFTVLWTVKLDKKNLKPVWIASLITSLLLGQLGFMISLWPLNILIASLFLVSFMYIILSLLQYHFSDRLFNRTINEYLRLGFILFLVTLIAARWG